MKPETEKTPDVRIQELEKQVRTLWGVIIGQYLGSLSYLIIRYFS